MYFEPKEWFNFRYLGRFWKKDNEYTLGQSELRSNIKTPWQNLDLKVGLLPQEIVQTLNLPDSKSWSRNATIQHYSSNELILSRAGFLNAYGFPQDALHVLEPLVKSEKWSTQLFFELAFANNALKLHDIAKQYLDKAFRLGFTDDLLLKEMHFTLMYQLKTKEGAAFLKSKLSQFKNSLFLSECILNQVYSAYREKDFAMTQEWIDVYRKEIGNDRYKTTIDQFEKALQLRNNPIK